MKNIEKVRLILPNRVRSIRNSRSLTQERLSEKIDIHPTYISRIESGKKIPTLVIICKIADALGVEVYELLMDETKITSYHYQKRKLINILNESKPTDLDACASFLYTWRKRRHKK